MFITKNLDCGNLRLLCVANSGWTDSFAKQKNAHSLRKDIYSALGSKGLTGKSRAGKGRKKEKATASTRVMAVAFLFRKKYRTSIRDVFGPSKKNTYKAAGVVQ